MEEIKKVQVVVIHGGMTFDSYDEYLSFLKNREVDINNFRAKNDWKASLGARLGDAFDVLTPRMPNNTNAHYVEWKIWFERILPFLHDDVILIGHSLGGIFLAKYLSEERMTKRVKATILIASPFDTAEGDESLGDFILPNSLELFASQGGVIHILHSTDDPVVSVDQVQKYKTHLPSAHIVIFEDRGHFKMDEFLELVHLVRSC